MIQEEIINGLTYIVKYDDKGNVIYKKLKSPELTDEQKAQLEEEARLREEEERKNRPVTVEMFEALSEQVNKSHQDVIDEYTLELINEGVIA